MPIPRGAFVCDPYDYDDPDDPGLGVGATTVYFDPEAHHTGVYDQYGNELVRVPRPIGFRFEDNEPQ